MHAGNGVRFFNTLTGNRYDEKAQLDLNLDGVFDDRDKEVFYDFNFAVLASSSSFSSANTMPIMCKDNGVCVLGEKSKGGACAVVFPFTPESHFLSLSGPLRTVSETGLDVDKGAPVDYELVETKTITDESGEQQEKKSYSKLYDLGLVGSLVSEFYAAKEPTTVPAPTESTAPAEGTAPAASTASAAGTTSASTKPATGSEAQKSSSSTGTVATGDGFVSAAVLLVLISSAVVLVWFRSKREKR